MHRRSLAFAALATLVVMAAAACTSTGPSNPTVGGTTMRLESPAFAAGAQIPLKYAGPRVPGGTNLSIPYAWNDPVPGTKSYAFALVDLSPVARGFVHWVVVDLPADSTGLDAGASGRAVPSGAIDLVNTAGRPGYVGPSPPAGSGPHEYKATLYALDVPTLSLPASATLQDAQAAMRGHVLAEASYSGFFEQ